MQTVTGRRFVCLSLLLLLLLLCGVRVVLSIGMIEYDRSRHARVVLNHPDNKDDNHCATFQ